MYAMISLQTFPKRNMSEQPQKDLPAAESAGLTPEERARRTEQGIAHLREVHPLAFNTLSIELLQSTEDFAGNDEIPEMTTMDTIVIKPEIKYCETPMCLGDRTVDDTLAHLAFDLDLKNGTTITVPVAALFENVAGGSVRFNQPTTRTGIKVSDLRQAMPEVDSPLPVLRISMSRSIEDTIAMRTGQFGRWLRTSVFGKGQTAA